MSAAWKILGLLLVVMELTRVQRQEFGTPMFIQKTTAFVLRLVGRRRTQTITGVGAFQRGAGRCRLEQTTAPVR